MLPLKETASFDNLINQHLPDLINHYLAFSEKDRLVIKDYNNQNSEQLLEKSLNDIILILNKHIDVINDIKITNLSIKNKHIEGLKINL